MAQLVRAPPCHGGGREFESLLKNAAVAELADAQDLKSCGTYTPVPVRFRSAAVVEREKRLDDSVSLIFYFKILVFPYEFKR